MSKRYLSSCEQTFINKDLDTTDKDSFFQYIQPLDDAILCKKYITFNSEGLRNDNNSLEYLKIFQKNLHVLSKLIFTQTNRHNNMSGGTLVCIPKQYS